MLLLDLLEKQTDEIYYSCWPGESRDFFAKCQEYFMLGTFYPQFCEPPDFSYHVYSRSWLKTRDCTVSLQRQECTFSFSNAKYRKMNIAYFIKLTAISLCQNEYRVTYSKTFNVTNLIKCILRGQEDIFGNIPRRIMQICRLE